MRHSSRHRETLRRLCGLRLLIGRIHRRPGQGRPAIRGIVKSKGVSYFESALRQLKRCLHPEGWLADRDRHTPSRTLRAGFAGADRARFQSSAAATVHERPANRYSRSVPETSVLRMSIHSRRSPESAGTKRDVMTRCAAGAVPDQQDRVLLAGLRSNSVTLESGRRSPAMWDPDTWRRAARRTRRAIGIHGEAFRPACRGRPPALHLAPLRVREETGLFRRESAAVCVLTT